MAEQRTVKPLRSDAERTVRAILEAAERTLSRNPAATMDEVAVAAGVARTTVHRRFATRQALVAAMAEWAARQFAAAVQAARPDTAPPLVALYQVTVNVLRVKLGWEFAMSLTSEADPEVARLHAEVLDSSDRLFHRAQRVGVLRDDVDLVWARRSYYALIHAAARDAAEDTSREADDAGTDALATRVVDTLLRGIGTH